MDQTNLLTERIIGCAIDVHRQLGAGLLENAYHSAMCIELATKGIAFEREPVVPVEYNGQLIAHYKPDLIIERQVVVEIKSVLKFEPVFTAQMLTYLRITNLKVGLLLNFDRTVLKDGIKRFVL